MKTVRVSYDRQEVRRDRRYPLPPLTLRIGGAEYVTANWSLGGFLLASYAPRVFIGEKLAGEVVVRDHPTPVPFNAVVLRLDEPAIGNLAAQFVELEDATVTLLDRMIARRLFRR